MSLQTNKTNSTLGHQVEKFLQEKGVNTPMADMGYQAIGDDTRIAEISRHFTEIMNILGLDLKDDSLEETPLRVAKMYVKELFWGLKPDNFPKCTVIENKMGYDEMVLERDIQVMSNCEHHFLPIEGKAHVAYIPKNKVLGLSKMNRIVEYFSRRPQVQERLAEQIYWALVYILETEDVAVVLEGEHFCVKMRGVEDPDSDTITSKLGGVFKHEPETRAELMTLITMKK